MDKAILLSVVFVAVLAPVLGARSPDPRRGLALTLLVVGLYNLFGTALVLYILPRLRE
jgi:hypothetical protein